MEANIEIAQSLFKQNKYQETIDLCNQIIASESKPFDALSFKAKSLLAINKIVEAREFFNKALNIQPDDYELIKELGNSYFFAGITISRFSSHYSIINNKATIFDLKYVFWDRQTSLSKSFINAQ